jgi:hypothetical protein
MLLHYKVRGTIFVDLIANITVMLCVCPSIPIFVCINIIPNLFLEVNVVSRWVQFDA